jgi:hypothetical protein
LIGVHRIITTAERQRTARDDHVSVIVEGIDASREHESSGLHFKRIVAKQGRIHCGDSDRATGDLEVIAAFDVPGEPEEMSRVC